jgi:hypothetical protein
MHGLVLFAESERFDNDSLVEFRRAVLELEELPPRAFLTGQLSVLAHAPYFVWVELWRAAMSESTCCTRWRGSSCSTGGD